MSQLTYNFNPPVGRAGLIAEMRESNVIISKLAEGLVPVGLLCSPGTDPEIGPPPGSASAESTNPGQCIQYPGSPTFTSDPVLGSQFIGIPIYDASRPPYTSSDQYSDQDYVPVMRQGVIWIATPDTVLQFGDVYVWGNPGGGDPPAGTFASSAHGGKAYLFPKGRWMTASNSGLAILEISL